MLNKIIFLITFVILLAGCTQLPSREERLQSAEQLAAGHGWQPLPLNGKEFNFLAIAPTSLHSADMLTVYLEGDGLAWLNRTTPSFDPTPLQPLALKLAVQDDQPAAYLARACQFLVSPQCSRKYWTSHRFAPELIAATDEALNQLKAHFHARHLTLVGYSGGGAMALLLAARRQDISALITVAGSLDQVAWTKALALTPLSGSLNAADEWQQVYRIPQAHLVGEQDTQVGIAAVQPYAQRFPANHRPQIIVQSGFTHHCCWAENWPTLLQETRAQLRAPAE